MLGFMMVGASSGPPDSMTSTCAPEADNSAAGTEPAAPAPTTMKSYRSSSLDTLLILNSQDLKLDFSDSRFCSQKYLSLTAVGVDPDQSVITTATNSASDLNFLSRGIAMEPCAAPCFERACSAIAVLEKLDVSNLISLEAR